MPEIVEMEATCPTCQTRKKFKVPMPDAEVIILPPKQTPPATITAASDEVTATVKRMEEKLKSIPDNFCTMFPELCKQVTESNQEVAGQLERVATALDHDHATLNDELLARWDACPHCKAIWEQKVADITEKALADKKAESPAPAPPAETKPETTPPKAESPPPADKVPPAKEETLTEEAEVDDGEFHLAFGKHK